MNSEQPQEDADEAAAQQEAQYTQREEDPCEDRCQLLEHKGYTTCQRAGCCLYEQSFGKGGPHG